MSKLNLVELRILQIVPTSEWGGGERYVYDLAEATKANGDKVFVVARKSNVVRKKFSDLNLPFFTLPLLFLFDVYSIVRLAFFIKKHQINVVHAHIFCDAFLSVFAKKLIRAKSVKVVMTRHLVKQGKNSFLYRYLYRNIDTLIFVSKAAESAFLSTVSAKDIRTAVVHNAVKDIPLEKMIPIDFRQKLNLDVHTKLLGFCGRLDPEKGVDLIIDALPQLLLQHNVVLLIAGAGDKKYTDCLHQKIHDLNLDGNVFFLGFLNDVFPFLAALDVAILPSRAKESFGLALVECMRAGCPVITTNTGAQEEIIENQETGLIIPPNSISEIVEKTKTLLENPDLYSKIRENALKSCESFNYATFFKTIHNLYTK
ncbi:MAG: glycosyltransferase family 4 protein [Bacteroidales bacterium]|nr:glycosyltransferase family 4 protein [Bacteroidales bacterium]